jgi:DHA3 family tetracycline resistance protein-like MFS transporter
MLEPLRIRDFALLWAGMTTSLVGDFVFLVAYPWQTYQLTNNPAALGWISAAYVAPTVIFVTAGGVLTDRIERRRLMIAADLLRAAATGTGAALAITHNLTLIDLGAVVAFGGLGAALFNPAFGSIVPEIVPVGQLPQANALDQFVRTGAGLVGPAVAGVVIAVAGVGWAFAIDAATFVVSVSTALALTSRPVEPSDEPRSALRDAREGWAFVRARTWLWASLVAAGLANVASGSRNVLLPLVVKNDLHSSARTLGFVYSAGAAGAIVASLAYAQRGYLKRPIVIAFIGWGVSILAIGAYGLSTNVGELLAFGLVAGAGTAIGNAVWGTLMHRRVPRALLGRVTSIDWMFSLSLMPVASAGSGLIAGAVGARETLAGAGLIAGVGTLAFLVIPALRAPELEPAGERVQPDR